MGYKDPIPTKSWTLLVHFASINNDRGMSLIARKIGVERDGNKILQGVDFRAPAGSLIGILGPSGSGKTTLMMALSGIRPPTSGTVSFNGKDLLKSFEEVKHNIGFVPQDDIVPTALKVERVLLYAAELRLENLEPAQRKKRVEEILKKLGLSERRSLRVSKLSGGQRKRVNVGVELLSEPKLLFADEPTSGLDPALERSLTETFRKLADDGSTVIVTTHVMTSLSLFDFLCLIVKGRLAYFGPPGKIKTYFGVEDFAEIYQKLGEKSPAEWNAIFRKSDFAL